MAVMPPPMPFMVSNKNANIRQFMSPSFVIIIKKATNVVTAFNRLKGVVKINAFKAKIDTAVFRLHYRATFLILMGSSLLVTVLQYGKDHIQCIQEDLFIKPIPDHVINNYCFISATFSVPKMYQDAKLKSSVDIPHAGIGPYRPDQDELVYHAYYQWVPFFLFGQALMFYAPYKLWKAVDDGKILKILQGLNVLTLGGGTGKENREKVLAKYLHDHLHDHNWWAACFLFCQLLNVANAVGQIYLVDKFLGGEFLTYGTDVVKFLELDPEQRVDPMVIIFFSHKNLHK